MTRAIVHEMLPERFCRTCGETADYLASTGQETKPASAEAIARYREEHPA